MTTHDRVPFYVGLVIGLLAEALVILYIVGFVWTLWRVATW